MKKALRISAVALIVLLATVLTTSCSILDYQGVLGSGVGGDKYMTREEVEKLLSEIETNVTVEDVNNYDININSDAQGNLLAASKALLSAVSIKCVFNVTYTSGWPFHQTYTTETASAGSGVIYRLDKARGDAYVITNYHVVYDVDSDTDDGISDDITVYLYGQEYSEYAISAEYVGGSKNYDIAVLRIDGSDVLRRSSAAAAALADSNEVSVLDTAIAIGNPEAEGISATVGVVNVESEELVMSSVDGLGEVKLRVMRIDAAVNGGNSGGGLFNDKGELIGIVNAKMSSSSIDNIGYAIPSNVAKYVTENIIYYDSLDESNDAVYRLMLGINVSITEAYVEYDTETGRVHKRERVAVSQVDKSSAASGVLEVGDVITSITVDGTQYLVTRTFNVIDVMLTARNDSTVVFWVIRDGKTVSVSVDMSDITPEAY